MPPKKEKKPRKKRAPAKKNKGLKQKQKQRQVVNVQVSAGGSGGGGYIPIPSMAPSIDYGLISQLIRPANTMDVPMREAAPIAAPIAVRPAEAESLAEVMPEASKARKERSDKGKSRAKPEVVSSSTAGMMRSESEYDVPVREAARSSDYYRRTGISLALPANTNS